MVTFTLDPPLIVYRISKNFCLTADHLELLWTLKKVGTIKKTGPSKMCGTRLITLLKQEACKKYLLCIKRVQARGARLRKKAPEAGQKVPKSVF